MVDESSIKPFLGRGEVFPQRRHPFYIVTPRYVRTSAGLKALHLLCHCLNAIGQPAFLIIHPPIYEGDPTNLDWNTPLLTESLARHHFEQGLTPVVIYPETIAGNPLNAPVVLRYVMNYPGLLGGDKVFAAEEIVFAYSRRLADAAGAGDNILFIPVSDTNTFHPPAPDAPPRKGACFWAAKYQDYHGGKLFPITKGAVEITRERPNSQTPAEIADLLRRSEVFYSYENTALAIEAMLCGCPAVFLPNEHFTECIGLEELGPDGFAWGAEWDEVARARATVGQGQANYARLVDRFWLQLLHMVQVGHARAQSVAYETPIELIEGTLQVEAEHVTDIVARYRAAHGSLGVVRKALQIWRRDGTAAVIRRVAFLSVAFLTRSRRAG